jgi:hypothetical protein
MPRDGHSDGSNRLQHPDMGPLLRHRQEGAMIIIFYPQIRELSVKSFDCLGHVQFDEED